MDKYTQGSIIGEGQFGVVRGATIKTTGTPVAIKYIRVPRPADGLPHPVARELLIASRLKHPFIVYTIEIFPSGSSMALVMERCASDLGTVLRARSACDPFPISSAALACKMLLSALDHVHLQGVLHRDVKPANCFLTSTGVLKLGDFGLSRMVDADMSHEVASRWYRAPELLFGQRSYGGEIDIWSAGCVFGELLRGFGGPLFAGDGDINQLSRIFDVLGTPTEETHPEVTQLPDWGKVHFEGKQGIGLRALMPWVPDSGLELLELMLAFNPKERPTAAQALKHRFFNEMGVSTC